MVTIHDVANAAGVSIATVSHVINKTKNVSEKTTKKVMKAVADMNYVPNTAAKSLKSNTYMTIGVIAEDMKAFSTSPIVDAICDFLNKEGYTVILCNLRIYSSSDYDIKLLKDSLIALDSSRAIGAIYIGAASPNVAYIRSLIKIPIIFTYSTALESDYAVNYDNYNAAKIAAQHFIQNGHRRLAILSGPLNQDFVKQRILGFQSALIEESLTLPPEYIVEANWNYNHAISQTLELMRLPERPTAIFAMNDFMACGAITAINSLKLRVPEDISVIGFDNRSCAAIYNPPITTIEIPLREIGHTAASTLLKLINCENPEKETLIKCKLIERSSVSREQFSDGLT